MSRRPRRNHTPAFKSKAALAAVKPPRPEDVAEAAKILANASLAS